MGKGTGKFPLLGISEDRFRLNLKGGPGLLGGSRGRKDPSRNSTEIFLMFGELNGPCVGPT